MRLDRILSFISCSAQERNQLNYFAAVEEADDAALEMRLSGENPHRIGCWPYALAEHGRLLASIYGSPAEWKAEMEADIKAPSKLISIWTLAAAHLAKARANWRVDGGLCRDMK